MLSKPLLLPSNGIPYNKIIQIKEPTVSFILANSSGWLSSSENELVYSLIKEYTNIKNPEKIYYKDTQFIYFYFLSLLNSNSIIEIQNFCEYCEYRSAIEVDLAELNVKYATKIDFENKKFEYEDFIFYFRSRKLIDNIETGIKNLPFKDKTVKSISNFIIPQFLNGTYKNEPFYDNEIEQILEEIGITQAIKIFDFVQQEEWGLPNSVKHYCTNCNFLNNIRISDPFISSMYFNPKISDIKNLLSTAISITGSKTISYNDFLNTPISLLEQLLEQIKDFLNKKYGKGKSDYLDQFEEELG